MKLCAGVSNFYRKLPSNCGFREVNHRNTHTLFNPLNAELNPTCYLLALLAHHFLHVSRIRVKSLTLRLLMSYIYIYDISSLRVNQLLYCVSLKIYNKFANYFCELKFSGNTHQRP